MKKMRKLIPALAMLLISAVMMSTASFAWFSINRNVTASGMAVTASADGSLVIVGPNDAVDNEFALSATSTSVNFIKNLTNNPDLVPSTWLEENVASSGSAAGYYTVTNTQVVDPGTGLPFIDPETEEPFKLQYGATTAGTHYKDYIIYVASAGVGFKGTLTANVTVPTALAGNQKALTIDFKVLTATGTEVSSYTVERDEALSVRGDQLSVTTPVAIELGNQTFPVNSEKYIPVVMRVYIDGAYKNSDDEVYVTSNSGSVASSAFNVTFTATPEGSGS